MSVTRYPNIPVIHKCWRSSGRQSLASQIVERVHGPLADAEMWFYDSDRKLVPVPTILKKDDGYKMDVERLRQEVKDMGVSVVVLSNPR